MAVKVFPTTNDVGGAGAGKIITESNLVSWLKPILGGSVVVNGFTVPASSATLNLDVAAGEALISGYRVVIDAATTLAMTASTTNYIYLKLTRDASNNVTGATFEVNATGIAPADSVKIAKATTSASAVTGTADARIVSLGAAANTNGVAYIRNQSGQLQFSADGVTWIDAGTQAYVDPVGLLIKG